MNGRRTLIWSGAALVLALAALPGCRESSASDAEAEAAKLYDLEFAATPEVDPEGKGSVTVRILPRGDAKVLEEAPLVLTVEPSEHVKVEKNRLGKGEMAKDGNNITFEVPFTATRAGEGSIQADVSFYICTDKLCVRQNRGAKLPVTVRQ